MPSGGQNEEEMRAGLERQASEQWICGWKEGFRRGGIVGTVQVFGGRAFRRVVRGATKRPLINTGGGTSGKGM